MKHVVIVACFLLGSACSKPQNEEPAKSSEKPAAATEKKKEDQPAQATSAVKLEKLGLVITPGEEVLVADGIGKNAYLLSGNKVGGLNVAEASDDFPKTLKAAEEEASLFKPKNLKKETLADGWVLTFENEGSAGTNHWVKVRREIKGKAISCDTVSDTAAKSAAAVAACKSLASG